MKTFDRLGDEYLMRGRSLCSAGKPNGPSGRIALVKWIRASLSDSDWDDFIERYGNSVRALYSVRPG